ncbi:hypothetical protein PGT21_029519 [Puccinia graminis f. sp. tritici]|uniref:Uncharacterized protein n=1 Tax=Puccinia graminis f. sp. tritici TaxID=56615 RepID=A0A5B0PP80_PUCGR|nr:hypothetical protein PGT21_029519 [Puccinia graminis f. sp. tritici]
MGGCAALFNIKIALLGRLDRLYLNLSISHLFTQRRADSTDFTSINLIPVFADGAEICRSENIAEATRTCSVRGTSPVARSFHQS